MATITLNDAKGAIQIAWEKWGEQEPGSFRYQLESGKDINIIYEQKDNTINYGIPNIYMIDQDQIPALKDWWENNESRKYNGQGVLKPREEKVAGVYGVNAYYEAAKNFNFHVPTT